MIRNVSWNKGIVVSSVNAADQLHANALEVCKYKPTIGKPGIMVAPGLAELDCERSLAGIDCRCIVKHRSAVDTDARPPADPSLFQTPATISASLTCGRRPFAPKGPQCRSYPVRCLHPGVCRLPGRRACGRLWEASGLVSGAGGGPVVLGVRLGDLLGRLDRPRHRPHVAVDDAPHDGGQRVSRVRGECPLQRHINWLVPRASARRWSKTTV